MTSVPAVPAKPHDSYLVIGEISEADAYKHAIHRIPRRVDLDAESFHFKLEDGFDSEAGIGPFRDWLLGLFWPEFLNVQVIYVAIPDELVPDGTQRRYARWILQEVLEAKGPHVEIVFY